MVCSALGIDTDEIRHLSANQEVDIDWKMEATLPNDPAYRLLSSASLLPRSSVAEILLTGTETPSGIRMLLELLSTRS